MSEKKSWSHREPAPTVNVPPDPVVANVTPATSAGTVARPRGSAATTTLSSATTRAIRRSTARGAAAGDGPSATGTPNSETSSEPSAPSTGHWVVPVDPMTFAYQANKVATAILNGEIDLDVARTYASVARTVAQAMNTEVNRARLEQSLPDLSMKEPQ